MRLVFSAFVGLFLLSSPAFAAGKAGLWTVTTDYQFSMSRVPAALVALAREEGIKPPVNGQPFIHHMCMTEYEADGSQPLHLNNRDLDCVTRLASQKRSQMVLESICHGQLEGVAHYQINWRGNLHFDGTYNFHGKFRGDPARISSAFSADWTDTSCRAIHPFVPQEN